MRLGLVGAASYLAITPLLAPAPALIVAFRPYEMMQWDNLPVRIFFAELRTASMLTRVAKSIPVGRALTEMELQGRSARQCVQHPARPAGDMFGGRAKTRLPPLQS